MDVIASEASSARSDGASARLVRRLREILLARIPRLFLLAAVSSVTGVIVLLVKVSVFIAAPDWFLLASILFAAGAIGSKVMMLRRRLHARRLNAAAGLEVERRAYRQTAFVIIGLSVLYLLVSLPATLKSSPFESQSMWAGITIAAAAFTELVLSFVAAFAGRRDVEPIASAIRRTNLANALILMALAQSALLTAAGAANPEISGATALGFGILAAGVGVQMLFLARRSTSLPTLARSRPTEP